MVLKMYWKCGVLCVADVFEQFRNSSLKNFGLFKSHNSSEPTLTWDAMVMFLKDIVKSVSQFSTKHWNTGLVSRGISLTSWGKGASIAWVGHLSSDGFTISIPYEVDPLLHWPALHLNYSY